MSARERVSASARTATSPGADGHVGTTAATVSTSAVSPTIADELVADLGADGVDEVLRDGDRDVGRPGRTVASTSAPV